MQFTKLVSAGRGKEETISGTISEIFKINPKLIRVTIVPTPIILRNRLARPKTG
jgi:hypothetical protein